MNRQVFDDLTFALSEHKYFQVLCVNTSWTVRQCLYGSSWRRGTFPHQMTSTAPHCSRSVSSSPFDICGCFANERLRLQ